MCHVGRCGRLACRTRWLVVSLAGSSRWRVTNEPARSRVPGAPTEALRNKLCALTHPKATTSNGPGTSSTPTAWSWVGWPARSRILRGKHQPFFAPHLDTGDHVVVINAAKVVYTGNSDDKFAYRHSGYPGGLRRRSYTELLVTKPDEVVRQAVRGMLPKNTLGRQQLAKLKVYPGPEHPHAAQDPQPLELASARRAS